MRSLVRVSNAGEVNVLTTSEGPVVELLGANGEEVLCRIGQAVFLVSAAQCSELDSGDLPSGRPQLHPHESGVLLFEEFDPKPRGRDVGLVRVLLEEHPLQDACVREPVLGQVVATLGQEVEDRVRLG